MNVNKSTLFRLLVISLFGMLPLVQATGAAGLGWVLYGKVVDGQTCAPIVNATVQSPYNSNASVMTNATGGYRLVLGTGAWNVTYAYTGYSTTKYSTPYETSGAFLYNASLLKTGETLNPACLTGAQPSPGNNATSSTTTVTSTAPPSSTSSTSGGGTAGALSTTTVEIIAVIVVVIIIIAAALLLRKKPAATHHKEQK